MKVKMNIGPHEGHSADQITDGMTLADLRDQLNDAIDEYGEDAEVVTYDGSQRYGAKFGRIYDIEGDADDDA